MLDQPLFLGIVAGHQHRFGAQLRADLEEGPVVRRIECRAQADQLQIEDLHPRVFHPGQGFAQHGPILHQRVATPPGAAGSRRTPTWS